MSASRGAARNMGAEAAISARANEAFGAARAGVEENAAVARGQIIGNAVTGLETYSRAFAQDAIAFANDWAGNQAGIRDNFNVMMTNLSLNVANMYREKANREWQSYYAKKAQDAEPSGWFTAGMGLLKLYTSMSPAGLADKIMSGAAGSPATPSAGSAVPNVMSGSGGAASGFGAGLSVLGQGMSSAWGTAMGGAGSASAALGTGGATAVGSAISSGASSIASGASSAISAIGSFFSSRKLKTSMKPISEEEILEKFLTLPIETWEYKSSAGHTHLGPYAEDFAQIFGLGNGTEIAYHDIIGIQSAAILALAKELRAIKENTNARK